MNWIKLISPEQISEIKEISKSNPVLLFKHSTTCSISNTTLNRLERNWKEEGMKISAFYLDLLNYRSISKEIAEEFQVEHQSPQVLIIKDGQSVYNNSHFGIDYPSIKDQLQKLEKGSLKIK